MYLSSAEIEEILYQKRKGKSESYSINFFYFSKLLKKGNMFVCAKPKWRGKCSASRVSFDCTTCVGE